jgi:hypothetical protein
MPGNSDSVVTRNTRKEKAIEIDPVKMCFEDLRWIELA